MKLILAVSISILLFLVLFIIYVTNVNLASHERKFNAFILKYKKDYLYNSPEYNKRLSIFKNNLKEQERLNSENGEDVYGITKFSDLTQDEFVKKLLTKMSYFKMDNTVTSVPSNVKLLKKVDWRKYVGRPRDQKACGGCWAFATIKGVEAINSKKVGKFTQLSIQEVIDCSRGFKESLWGCEGGNICSAMDWLQNKHISITTESSYPLKDADEECKRTSSTSGIKLTKYICGAGEDFLKTSLQKGPVAVAVDAASWIHYANGIIKFHCDKQLNHAVLVVGYDMEGEVPHYLVQNSWGNDWGEDGYLKIRMDKGLCGIDQQIGLVEDVK
ncbi:DgyrCDS10459 [Dimorphilus gyrociliatus]|uniref:DgyrCDS10459 n=1 Tax=Dimorphilus gyrociliatus TaxID=2664684 RepID=A0A7I8W298_9ANNE|nr:DgyrCDS10459 [Dimorphilus gyrociliatus]